MWVARYWFRDASNSVSSTSAKLRTPNLDAVFALANAIQALSDASLYKIELQRRYVVGVDTPATYPDAVLVVPANYRDTNGYPLDALYLRVPSETNTLNELSTNYRGLLFTTPAGYEISPAESGYLDAVALEPYPTNDTEDYVLVAIRRNFWLKLLDDAIRYNTLSQQVDNGERVRLDIYDLFQAVDMREVLQRLDTIIQLMQQDDEDDEALIALLQQIIALIGT